MRVRNFFFETPLSFIFLDSVSGSLSRKIFVEFFIQKFFQLFYLKFLSDFFVEIFIQNFFSTFIPNFFSTFLSKNFTHEFFRTRIQTTLTYTHFSCSKSPQEQGSTFAPTFSITFSKNQRRDRGIVLFQN